MMSRIILVTVLLGTPVLCFSPSSARAQASNSGAILDRVEGCQTSGGGSRIKANCALEQQTDVRPLVLTAPSIKAPDLQDDQCEVTAATNYQQRNTSARVDGAIQVTDCTAAEGTFTLAVRVRDDAGETKVIDFHESWQRDNAREVRFASDYPIGENVELVSVRVRDLTCTCADAPDAAADASSDASSDDASPDSSPN